MINAKSRFESLNALEQWADTNMKKFLYGSCKAFHFKLKIKLYKYVIRRPELKHFL